MPRSLPASLGLILLVVLHVVFAGVLVVPGHLSIDEGAYHLMAEAARHGRLTIENGYEAFPSVELAIMVKDATQHVAPHGGHLVAQYPALSSFLVAPLYALEGYRALFHLNALAFLVAIWLCWRLGRRLYADPATGWVAAGVFALGTYAWVFAQAAWPHMLHVTLCLGATLAVVAARDGVGRRGPWLALLGGGLMGLDLGVRLDGLLILAGLALLALGARPLRWGRAGALVAGALPGVVFLSLTNHLKFGTWSPLSYGGGGALDLTRYLPFVAIALLVLAERVVGIPAGLRRRPRLLAALGLGAVAVLVAVSATRAPLLRLLQGAYALGIDLRALPEQEAWRHATRGAGGGLVYFGGYKKALLQSMPWLVLGVVALRRWLRREPGAEVVPTLLVVPALLVAAYAYGGWHGGACLDLRYFAPVLPFAALLVAPAVVDLVRALRGPGWAAALALAAGVGALIPLSPAPSGGAILATPLVLAAALGATIALSWLPSLAATRSLRMATALLATAALGWSTALTFGYDARLERRWRALTWSMEVEAAPLLPEHALLIVDWIDPWFGLAADGRVRLASPVHDGGADLPALVAGHVAQGWPVFAALAPKNWALQRAMPFMGGYRVEGLQPVGQVQLGRIEPLP